MRLSFEISIVTKEIVNNRETDIWKYESTRGIDWSKIPIEQMENQIQSTFGASNYFRLFIFESSSSNHLYFGHSKVSFLFITTTAKGFVHCFFFIVEVLFDSVLKILLFLPIGFLCINNYYKVME